MTPAEVRTVLTILHVAHDRTVPDGLVDVWSAALEDVPFDLARAAALDLIRTGVFLPKVAELRGAAKAIAAERRRGTADALAIPSRFEDDEERAERVRRGAALCRAVLVGTRLAAHPPEEP